ncbi:MAG: hypothetical protein E7563_03325 [Ruminococcaceae bacterium]|nr:hypothetical protein [Oscillospiraceae bacterium]
MKKISILALVLLLLVSIIFCGCSKQVSDYIVNNNESINIGVLITDESSESQGITSGINYAFERANAINLDKRYTINLSTSVAKDINEINVVAEQFESYNVAAVICQGKDKETTDAIIESFSEYNNLPLIFIDCYSNLIYEKENVFSISVPYSYQASAVVSHLISESKTTGAVICATDDDYYKNFAKVFESTFTQNSGTVTTYYYSGENCNFNANTVASSAYDFVFIIGNTNEKIQIYSELISAGVTSNIIFSEVTDKLCLEDTDYNNITYISKFEQDDNNYIGTDFINTYSSANNISRSDVTADIAYGYDAYMTVYDALVSLNPNRNPLVQNTEPAEETKSEIYTKDVADAIKTITHMGVTDIIRFDKNGLSTPAFIYTSRIDNAHSGMLSRYNFNNEQN